MEERILEFWLTNISGAGLSWLTSIRATYSLEELFCLHPDKVKSVLNKSRIKEDEFLLSRDYSVWEEKWKEMEQKEILYISYFDENYPEKLRHLYRPPKHLYVKGRLPQEKMPTLAIVGARDCTAYGRDMARMFSYRLCECGMSIVSGMAKGIDGWAHQGALESGGYTCAVLGNGVDICYPKEHRRLYESLVKRGGVVSEFLPGEPARPGYFPMRNRIISGLAEGLLVVEAREKSGSLITADAALEQGKDVFVIPGRIGDVLSVGCNRLIRQGAIPVLSPDDILEYYDIRRSIYIEETQSENVVLQQMGAKPISAKELAKMLGMKELEVYKTLLELKREQKIFETTKDFFIKR